MSDTPPTTERAEMRVLKPVNLRTEPSTKVKSNGMLEKNAIVWQDGQEGDWFEVWVHGWVRKDFVKLIVSE
jgi:hypothetical protein